MKRGIFVIVFVGLLIVVGLSILVVLIWSDSSRNVVGVLSPKGRGIFCLLFSPDGKRLVVGASSSTTNLENPKFWEGGLSVWDIATQTQMHTVHFPQWIRSMSMSQQGDVLAVSCGCTDARTDTEGGGFKPIPGEARVYSFPDMKEKLKLQDGWSIHSLALSPDGKLLATSSGKSVSSTIPRPPTLVKIWDTFTWKLKYEIQATAGLVCVTRFSPDSKVLAVSDMVVPKGPEYHPVIRQFKAETGEPINVLQLTRRKRIDDFSYFPDGKNIITSSDVLDSLDVETGTRTELGDQGGRRPLRISTAISTDGKWLIIGNDIIPGSAERGDGPAHIMVWDVEAKKVHDEWKLYPKDRWEPPPPVSAVALSPDKKLLAVGSDKVYLYELKIE